MKSRGWCNRHYLKWWNHGDPLGGIDYKLAPTLAERMLQHAPGLGRETDECIEWLGAKDHRGYGTVTFDGVTRRAHRVSLGLAIGRDVEPGLSVLHSCDNPPCINPRHLSEGTQLENVADAMERGRWAVGSRAASAKLTEEIVMDILSRSPKPRPRDIAEELGIDSATACRVLNRQSWKHVKVGEV